MSDLQSFTRFVPIAKVDKAQQMVWGYASTPALDLDDERVSLSAIKRALPDYLEWSNIREMHQPSAVGVAKEATVDEKGLWLGAKITDPLAWQKCLDRVYKGFSIGGQVLKKTGKVIEELLLVEISVVDRPANPECRIEIVKSARPTRDQEGYLVPSVDVMPLLAAEEEGLVGRIVSSVLKSLGIGKRGDGMSHPAETRTDDVDMSGHKPTEHGLLPGVPTDLPDPGAPTKSPFESHLEPVGKDADEKARKPYGDVEYADPGHQSDKVHRYPIDTEEHIRAAWNYIHKPGNADKYSPEQASEIRSRIEAAWRDKIDPQGPPSAEKTADFDSDFWNPPELSKSMWDVNSLVSAFESLRDVQRSRVGEGEVEGDDGDGDMAERAGVLAQQVARLIADVATHEGREARTMTDASDIRQSEYNQVYVRSAGMTDTPADLAKRASKAALGKAMDHLNKAAMCQKSAMSACGKLAEMHKEAAMSSKSAQALGKAADPFDHATAMEHVHKCAAALSQMGDHHEMAQHFLGKAAGMDNGTNTDDWGGTHPEGTHPPSGGIQPPAAGPTPGKAVEATYTQAQVDQIRELAEKAAKAEGELEAIRRMPGGPNRARLFEVGKAVGVPTATATTRPMELLLEGVDTRDQSPDGVSKSAGRMIANMIKNSSVFGKNPATDPSFRGLAG